MTNKSRTLYIGVTNNLKRRVYEHQQGLIEGFTKKYKIKELVYYEYFTNINDAIAREKQLKKWGRQKKIELIEKYNPSWKNLNNDLE